MNTTLETELRRQIGVILTIADRVISGERGTTQRELYRVAKALEKHLPAPALTAEQKLQTIRAEIQEHYRRLEMNPENIPQHFAALRSAVEAIVGRKEPEPLLAMCSKCKGTFRAGALMTISGSGEDTIRICEACHKIDSSEAHYPPMKVEEVRYEIVREIPTCCPKCNSTNFIKSGNGWRCGGSFGDGCGWACVVVEEAPGPFPETTNITRGPITVERPSLDSAALALMKKSAETLRERVNMLHDRGWSETASTVEEVAAELESFCDRAEDASLREKEAPSDVAAIFDEIKSWRSRALASEKERDDLKARLAHYEDAYRRIDVFIVQNKELRRQVAEWERLSKEHENARDLLQREVTRLTRERDQLREDLADEFSRVNKIRTAISTVDVSNDGPQFLAEVQHILSEL